MRRAVTDGMDFSSPDLPASRRPNGVARLNFRLNLVVPKLVADLENSVHGGR